MLSVSGTDARLAQELAFGDSEPVA